MMVFRNVLLLVVSLSQLVQYSQGFGVSPLIPCSSAATARIQTQRFESTSITESSSTAPPSVVERLGLDDNFNRWKYVQNLLDEELGAADVNEVLYVLLDNYKNIAADVDPDDSSAPERTAEVLGDVDAVLQMATDGNSIPVLKDPDCQPGDEKVVLAVERLLPDPVEKEDAFKGSWDTVMEMHGRTSAAFNEKENRPEWNAVCITARVMIYFEFLTGDGLLL